MSSVVPRWMWPIIGAAIFLGGWAAGSNLAVDRVQGDVAKETEAVLQHRERNEIVHDCIIDFMDAITKAAHDGTLLSPGTDFSLKPESCPEPLTPEEIRDIRKGE